MEKYIKVEPDSPEFDIRIEQFPVFQLESPAENGRANAELVRRIKEITGVKPGIVSGHHSRRKNIRLDMDEDEFMDKIKGV